MTSLLTGTIAGLAAALLGTLCSSSAEALVVVYNDKAAFATDTLAASATGALPLLGRNTSDPSAVGSITFDAISPSSIQLGTTDYFGGWSTRIPGNDLAINDQENFDIVASAPVFAMGFDVHEPMKSGFDTDTCGIAEPCTDSTFTVTILDGAESVGSQTVNFPNDALGFFGIWSDRAFDRFQVRETIGGIDDEFFGEVYTGSTRLPVPEPTVVMLFASGTAALVVMRKRADAGSGW